MKHDNRLTTAVDGWSHDKISKDRRAQVSRIIRKWVPTILFNFFLLSCLIWLFEASILRLDYSQCLTHAPSSQQLSPKPPQMQPTNSGSRPFSHPT